MSQEVTRTLARWIVGSRLEAIPAEVRQSGVSSFLNWMGCAVGGSQHETLDRAIAALAPFSGPKQATILGRKEHFDVMHAALLNGISSHVFDFDDTHLKTIIHPAGPIASAVLALAEYQPMTGAELLHAFIIGVEVECRIGNSVYPAHYDIGWHITGTAGVFGAAAAAGKLLGLDEQQMTWALGIAGTQSAGFREMFGTMCKSFHPGRAAQSGLSAALLAEKHFTSSPRAIEAPRGFAHVLSTKFDPSTITDGLGQRYELSLNMYKPYACGLVVHAAIDGCIQLKREHALTADMIAAVHVKTSPLVPELTAIRKPQTGLEGKFSIFHACAVALAVGAAGEPQFADAVVRNPQIAALRDRVAITADAGIRKLEAYVTVTLKDGRTLEKHVPHALGTVERPMSDADLEEKFRSLTADMLPPAQSDRIIGLVWQLDTLADVGEIARATVTP